MTTIFSGGGGELEAALAAKKAAWDVVMQNASMDDKLAVLTNYWQRYCKQFSTWFLGLTKTRMQVRIDARSSVSSTDRPPS
jgi:hypothetical protein